MKTFYKLFRFSGIAEIESYKIAWKVSRYRIISDPYFSPFRVNRAKYGPEITPDKISTKEIK